MDTRRAATLAHAWIAAVVGWAIAAALVFAYAATLRRYAINFPWADDFTQLLNVPFNVAHAPTLEEKLAQIFGLAVEHRIATLRLAALAQAQFLGGLDFRGLMYVGSALLAIPAVLLVSMVRREAQPLFAAIAAALLLSPANFEASLWATGALQHFGAVGYAFAALYCLRRVGWARQVGAAVFALAALSTSAGGLMLLPAAVLLLGLMRRWGAALGWTIGGATVFAVYFIGYEAPAYQASLTTYLSDPIVPLRFFLLALGTLGFVPSIAVALGVALVAFWTGLSLTRRVETLPPVIVAWAAFLVLTFAAITWGRAGFGDQGALLSRYRVYGELLVLTSLAASFFQLPPGRAMRLLWIALPLSIAWFFAAWRHDATQVERFFISHRTQLDYYVAEGHSTPGDPMPAAFRDFVLLGARQVGAYDPARFANKPRSLIADARALDASRPPAVRVESPIAGKRALLVSALGVGHEHDSVIWLESGQRQYRGALGALPAAPLPLGETAGFLWVCILSPMSRPADTGSASE